MGEGLKNYSTKIPVSATVGEITALLMDAGASDILTSYTDRKPVGLRFLLHTPYGRQLFSLPANTEQVLRVLEAHHRAGHNRSGVRIDQAQAERVGWRILRDWLDAQLALVEIGMATADQVLLPYRMVDGERTVYQAVVAGGGLLPGIDVPLLPEGRG